MSPETHLLASWIIAAKTTDNARDCRLVTLAGILPDADGLGLIADIVSNLFGGRQTHFYFNRWLSVALFLWALWLPLRLGHSVVGVFSRRADQVSIDVVRKWHDAWAQRREPAR